jgi:lysophospholipase L1-like esterase
MLMRDVILAVERLLPDRSSAPDDPAYSTNCAMMLHMRFPVSLTLLLRSSAALVVVAGLSGQVGAGGKPREKSDHWVATWAASPSPASPDPVQMRRRKMEFNNQTVREIVHITLGGEQFRVRLSNVFGAQALAIGAAHLAIRDKGPAIAAGSDRTLTFGGRPAVSIPPGALVLSDPVDLKAPASADLAVSLYLAAGPTIAGTLHYSAQQTSYLGSGDTCAALQMPDDSTVASWPFLTGVDVMAPKAAATIVTFGDSITDGSRSTADTNRRWPNILANRLLAERKSHLAVVNAGIGGNRILHDGAGANGPQYGPSALARFERDVLAQPGVQYVIVLEGVNDIGHPGGAAPMSEDVSAEDMIAGLRQLIERAHERGLKIFGGTIMPFTVMPLTAASSPKEDKRQSVNRWLRGRNDFDGVIDFDKTVRDPAQPVQFLAAYDSGDHLHPNDAGHKAMGDAVDLSLFPR